MTDEFKDRIDVHFIRSIIASVASTLHCGAGNPSAQPPTASIIFSRYSGLR